MIYWIIWKYLILSQIHLLFVEYYWLYLLLLHFQKEVLHHYDQTIEHNVKSELWVRPIWNSSKLSLNAMMWCWTFYSNLVLFKTCKKVSHPKQQRPSKETEVMISANKKIRTKSFTSINLWNTDCQAGTLYEIVWLYNH